MLFAFLFRRYQLLGTVRIHEPCRRPEEAQPSWAGLVKVQVLSYRPVRYQYSVGDSANPVRCVITVHVILLRPKSLPASSFVKLTIRSSFLRSLLGDCSSSSRVGEIKDASINVFIVSSLRHRKTPIIG